MKKCMFSLLVTGAIFMTSVSAQNSDSTMDSVSYSLGVLMAQNLEKQGFSNLDSESIARGIADVLSGQPTQVSVSQANQIVQTYLQEQQAKAFESKIDEGEKFLEENGKREEVTVLPSGLQYEVMKAGDGPQPNKDQRVTVHYHGTLLDGTVFDSSVQRGEPATFGVTQVIPGWVEALQLMPQGSKWKLFIPFDLAYGERGTRGAIGPYETLIFEVELLEIQ